ncbi:MAG: sigma-70 family RNA polymerase sigma factor [Pirellulales bacterium]|nr:sigma-70 family RNA polymerase sigma factor [Pirellulales bacterium]
MIEGNDIEDSDCHDKRTAFVERLTASQQPLYSYLNTMLCGDANVQDVLQETNLDLWQKADQYDLDRPFLPWAFRFAYFRVLAYRKVQGASKMVLSDDLLNRLDAAYRASSDRSNERLAALSNCLQKLASSQRQLIHLRYEREYSAIEIGEKIGATAAQVAARLHRLRRMLSDCIERQVRLEGN